MTALPLVEPLPCQTAVLIVGAGPAGLALAVSLRQLGVDHVLIDRGAGIGPGSRAAAVQPRTLEYLDRIGVGAPLVRAGTKARGFSLHDRDRTLLRACYDQLDTPHPYMLLASQQRTEEHLLARLEELGGAVHRNHRLLGITPDRPGVSATVAGPDGVLRAVSARYLIGCDGLHSTVRTAAGITFPGTAREQLFALADVRLKAGTRAADCEDPTFFLSSAGMLLLSPLAGGLHRLVAPAAAGSAAPCAADVERLLAERGPAQGAARVAEVVAASTYRVQERVAESFRAGPVLLVGDAAHTHSPAGGQGMNTGIQDAGNLAWKLHAVLSGTAPEELLDSYHRERHPVARALVSFTARFAEAAALTDPAACTRRNALLSAAAGTPGTTGWIAAKLAQLDIGYTDRPDLDTPRPGTRVSPRLVPPDGLHWTLALPGTPTAAAAAPDTSAVHGLLTVRHIPALDTTLLVRPDGYLAAHGLPATPGEVAARLADHLPLDPSA
ncbi:2-polyprenyl-6-methoxyphenol hydroxylase-like FAD-dependent oxidoreductase [Streptomyces sp. 1114.5]|uniref:FAD-dependent monooxygenase n=1 Tax=Streptomyces sp. 1114.5 TaxID=1938830 RepID=UPI000EABC056|nr:FAD-dependent monooxygenase [Streptomyces sp. 1114.5]RKT18292.1 2-polyprenyl-6-methoxyphenol hydroxylase-like FAD-dependent oxidoreductase [Streptomyces sp. 1114.5]